MKNVYAVTFNTDDGYTFELFTNARKALSFARQATNTDTDLVTETQELRKTRNGGLVHFYNKDDIRFTVSKEQIN